MNCRKFSRQLKLPALSLAALALAAAPSFAVELAAVEATTATPDGNTIPMWGFVEVTDAATFDCTTVNPLDAWNIGPKLTATVGGSLAVNVKNCLADPVSVFIPGQIKATTPATFIDGQGRTRVRSFDAETAAGAVGSYIWTSVKEGTYLYHSGTHPQVQVQMGLYGALTVGSYGYTSEATLVYSEIDPALHAAVANGTYGTPAYPSTFDYKPRYFLINGAPYSPGAADIAVETSTDVLLRFVNAGLQTHVPTLEGGLYMSLIAEDGNLYPFAIEQYGVELPAAKTIDAVVNVGADGRYALYDRALALTNWLQTGGGMLTYLQAGAAVGAPSALDDAYATDEGVLLAVALPGVLVNDSIGGGPGPLTANLVSDVSAGTLALISDGSFTYTPSGDFYGVDVFTYVANDGASDSNLASVRITVNPVNDGPVAMADAYDAEEGAILTVAAPGVLGNDVDVDGDVLTANVIGAPAGLALNPDGSFAYTPAGLAGTFETFDYEACDSALLCSTATVTITVIPAAANVAPFANDDFATTTRNTPVTFSVTDNDVDADGFINVASVIITSGATTQRGGTVVVNPLLDGSVIYTPKNGFRGTDLFTYTVVDDLGATSNEATVRVNVVKP